MIKDYFDQKGQEIADKMEHTPARKLTLVLLGILSVGVIVLGFLQIKLRIESPFFAQRLVEDKAKIRGPREFFDFFVSEQENQTDLTTLQKKDSDQDTLTDYQEIYIYKTSAYNNDSDGDKVSDDQEIALGKDPNCPEGRECDGEGFLTDVPVTTTTAPQVLDPTQLLLNSQGGIEALNLLPGEDKTQLKEVFNKLTSTEIRELLKAQGAPATQVDALSDEELKTAIDSLLKAF